MKTTKRCLAGVLCLLMLALCAIVLAACDTCSHSWGKWTEATKATCTEAGVKERKCLKCGEVEASSVAALGHDWKESTCQEAKTCKTCSATEGSPSGHIPEADDGDCTTDILCSVCGVVTIPGNATHAGGEATCTNKAECNLCGKEYGELAEHIPEADDGDCTTDIHCSVCGAVTENTGHVGGEATCINKANCEICGKEYGELAEHIPEADDGDCTTDVNCSVCGVITTPANATHTGGEATCINKANCEICGKEYGELAEHIPEADDGDCTTDVHCSVCGTVTTPGKEDHEFVPTIMGSSVEVTSGATQVSVVISIEDNPGTVGLTMSVQYSSSFLTLTDARSGDAMGALTFTAPSNLNNGCTFMWDAVEIEDKDVKNGEMLILTFDVSPDAPEGAYSILLNVSAFDNDLNSISFVISGGKVVVSNN